MHSGGLGGPDHAVEHGDGIVRLALPTSRVRAGQALGAAGGALGEVAP